MTADVRRRQQQQRRQGEERASSAAQTAAWQGKHLPEPQKKWSQQSRRYGVGPEGHGRGETVGGLRGLGGCVVIRSRLCPGPVRTARI